MPRILAAVLAAVLVALALVGPVGAPPAGAAGSHVVSAYVDDDAGQPRQGARVTLFYGGDPASPPPAAAYSALTNATTDATGRVDFVGMPDGYYKARVDAGGGWAETWWGGGTDVASAPWFGAAATNPNPVVGPIATDRVGSAVVSPAGDQFGYTLPASCYLDLDGQQYGADIFNGSFQVPGLRPGSYTGQVVCERAAPAAVTFVVGRSSTGGDPTAEVAVPPISIDYEVGPVTLTLPPDGLEVGRTVSSAVMITPQPRSPTYRWLVGGVHDAQASGYYYFTVAERHRGRTIAVQVCVNASSICSTSDETPAVPGGTTPVPAPPVVSAAPVVAGAAVVGSTLTSTTGTWSPAGTSYARQWLRDGVAVAGATGTSYAVRPGDLGRRLAVRVTATNADGSASSTSAATAAVAPGTLRRLTVTRLTGTPRVGQLLRVARGTYAPAAAASYVWKVGASVVGRGPQLRVRQAWLGRRVGVVVTYSATGYRPATAALRSATVRR